jgi:filamentous hemagglutinin family protein
MMTARSGYRPDPDSPPCLARTGSPVRLRGVRLRGVLLASSALQMVAALAVAQPAPSARPMGGTVVAGSATISQAASQTTITQSSSRAAVNWQSFDVGSQHSVRFAQPSGSAVTLNRVTGPDPSAIAGRIDANGQVVLVNQSGVVFYRGAQVNTAGLTVSTANISTQNFMAGRMAYDQPGRPDARIDNQGSITVKDAGLAAFVAPQVANSGVIDARLGHVVLAGAQAATLDLYGDGLLSIDVTKQVTRTPNGPDGRPVTALVTNTGTIRADGGTVQLTAQAADGIIQTLVDAGGRIRSATTAGRTGTIAVSGIGGSITVEGQMTAAGPAPATQGGAIELTASNQVTVAPTARLDVSGRSGGGTIAVGTTLARARTQTGKGGTPSGTAQQVTVANRAELHADARDSGNGGQIAVLSTRSTTAGGLVTARGGAQGGNGGQVEISGGGGLTITGQVDTAAPAGRMGTLLVDPTDLVIGDTETNTNPAVPLADGSNQPATGTQTISAASFNRFLANITLNATNSIELVGSTVLAPRANVNLTANAILVDVGLQPIGSVTLKGGTGAGTVTLIAPAGLTVPVGVTIAAGVTVTGTAITLAGNTLAIGGLLSAGAGTVTLTANGVIGSTAGITAGTLTGSAGGTVALSGDNAITAIGDFTVTGAGSAFSLADGGALAITGVLNAPAVNLSATSIAIPGTIIGPNLVNLTALDGAIKQTAPGAITTAALTGSATGDLVLTGTNNAIGGIGPFSDRNFTVQVATTTPLSVTGVAAAGVTLSAPAITIAGGLSSTNAVTLTATGGGITETPAGAIAAPTLLGGAAGPVVLDGTNGIAAVGAFVPGVGRLVFAAPDQPFTLATTQALALNGLTAGAATLTAPAITLSQSLTVPSGGRISLVTDSLTIDPPATLSAPAGTIEFAPLTAGSALTVGAAGVADLAITPAVIAAITPATGTLRLGSTTGAATPAAGSITFPGSVDFTPHAATVELDTTGRITQAAGAIVTAATLRGQAGQGVALSEANRIGTLGGFTVTDGTFALTDNQALTLGGLLSAPNLLVSAVGQLTLAGNIATTGAPLAAQSGAAPAAAGSTLTVQTAVSGPTGITQTGIGTLSGLGGTPATLRLELPATGGSVSLAGLEAAGANLVLGLGSGTASGSVAAGSLLVIGAGGSAALTGSVAGVGGPAAALRAAIQPASATAYTFNGCEIAAPDCGGSGPFTYRPPPVIITLPSAQVTVVGSVPTEPQQVSVGVPVTLAPTDALASLQLVPGGLPPVSVLPKLVVVALPSLAAPPRQLTDPDVVPPNVSVLDY